MATASPITPRALFFAASPFYLDPLLAQFNYIAHEGVSGVAGPRIPNEHTIARGEFALTTSRHPPRVKKVAFADIITTNEGDVYSVPPALASPSSDGSMDSLASGSSASSSSSRSSTDAQGQAGGQGQDLNLLQTTQAKGKAKI